MNARDIREVRTRLKLSQQGLAVKLGVSVATVHRWEAGHCPVPPLLARALRDVEAEEKAKLCENTTIL